MIQASNSKCGIGNFEVVKRWVNEATEALFSDDIMVQYHALGFLYMVRHSDRLSVTKMVSKLVKSPMKSSFSTCLLIRMVAKLVEEDYHEEYFEFIESCLRHKSEMVFTYYLIPQFRNYSET